MAIRQAVLLHILSGLIFLWGTLFACSCSSQTTRGDSTTMWQKPSHKVILVGMRLCHFDGKYQREHSNKKQFRNAEGRIFLALLWRRKHRNMKESEEKKFLLLD